MDVFLKKYFWVVDLVAVGICAALAGRATSHLIEQNWLLGVDDASATAARGGMAGPEDKTRSKEVSAIIDRNVFCSGCRPPPPPVAAEGGDEGEEVGNGDPVKTGLPLELVSTEYVPEDPKWSRAVIRDLASKTKDAYIFSQGKELPGGATVLRVDPKKVYISNAGRIEYLELEGGPAPGGAAAGREMAPVAAATPGSLEPLDQDVQRGVKCTGPQCEIERGLVDKLLANTTALATAARFVPSVKDGRPNGFKLYAIRPSSIFGKIGLQNGDTVKSINGMEMSSPDQALGVYTKLRSASHLTVSVERRGENVTLDYTIR